MPQDAPAPPVQVRRPNAVVSRSLPATSPSANLKAAVAAGTAAAAAGSSSGAGGGGRGGGGGGGVPVGGSGDTSGDTFAVRPRGSGSSSSLVGGVGGPGRSKAGSVGAAEEAHDYVVRILMLGDTGVGKSSLMVRFSDDTFEQGGLVTTAGVDFRTRYITCEGRRVKLQLWDTAGQQRFHKITQAYYKDAHAILAVYDPPATRPIFLAPPTRRFPVDSRAGDGASFVAAPLQVRGGR